MSYSYHNGLGTVTLEDLEVKKIIEERDFFLEAFLVVLNEKITNNSYDMLWTKEEALTIALKIYRDSDYNQDFINSVFNIKEKV